MTGFLSPTHILLLLVVALLLFGAKRLPEFGRSLGSGMREFKHSLSLEPGSGAEQTSLVAGEPKSESSAEADEATA